MRHSLSWLARELSHAAAQQRRAVLLVHAHKDLGLLKDASFAPMLRAGNVAALFYGHVHIKPWGYAGEFPGTTVPTFNCGASWFRVFCLAEFGDAGFRVAAVRHDAEGAPYWFGSAAFALPPRGAPGMPRQRSVTLNPNVTY